MGKWNGNVFFYHHALFYRFIITICVNIYIIYRRTQHRKGVYKGTYRRSGEQEAKIKEARQLSKATCHMEAEHVCIVLAERVGLK